ncbi:hypothetical protein D8674_009083 [Pyrus ussuriensis x Pyrus communis]|uniref:Uncharacterized protein n=1 Tax=Pyrus ussuriensis x Pyrus communis TaxID=2448454 RepID=A0A5N5I7M5_9ROSA|nr:hypothetical protein D8674_009083 [Pyrus ussuriensis x Pyrus communis]
MEEVEVEPPLAVLLAPKRGKTTKDQAKNPNPEPEPVRIDPEPARIEPEGVRIEPETVRIGEEGSRNGPRVSVSMFDDSVENHFRVMDTIAKLCGEAEEDGGVEDGEIQRLSSSVTFLREWADFKYEPRDGEDVVGGINLRQFSSATVPKDKALSGGAPSPELSQDFVMYVGGPVWALDWCPRVHQSSDNHPKCEPLTGRGAIQIWCLLNVGVNKEDIHSIVEKPKQGSKNGGARQEKSTEPKKPLGRHRKKPIEEKSTEPKRRRPKKYATEDYVDNLDESNNYVEVPAIEYPEGSLELPSTDCVPANTYVHAVQEDHGKQRKSYKHVAASDPARKSHVRRRKLNNIESAGSDNSDTYPPLLNQDGEKGSFGSDYHTQRNSGQDPHNSYACPPLLDQDAEKGPLVSDLQNSGQDPLNIYTSPLLLNQDGEKGLPVSDHHTQQNSGQDPQTSKNVQNNGYSEIGSTRCSVATDVALPRIVLCLAHHGKVAWDVKWRPCNEHDSKCKHRMGYLAVLSGNGSLEVWDVPLPHAIEVIYSSSCGEGTDPRFVKLAPVFRCSMLKCSGEKSIPLTVEWSPSPPHDYLLVGCHDGTVALWKFSVSNASQDKRPLLCFRADTNPIRALAWAPAESNSEGANLIATAGHGGLKFWDLCDPFRPLWDLDHLPRFIYSLNWLPDPRCVILSFDDGTMKGISLVKAASDDPVTGRVGTKQPGLHNLSCLPFAIWSVHASLLTGMVAYCGADGTVLRFQILDGTEPHIFCVSLTMEESAIAINTPVSNSPFRLKVVRNNADKVKTTNDKTAKDNTSEDQSLAPCYGDDPGIESDTGGKLASLKSQKTQKSKSSTKMPDDDWAMVCLDEEPTNTQEEETGVASLESKKAKKSESSKKKPDDDQVSVCMDEEPTNREEETVKEPEVFPDKIVAMHRVRWNTNKGSERWLCYGGAAGIVRCQEIVLSGVDKAWAAKRCEAMFLVYSFVCKKEKRERN